MGGSGLAEWYFFNYTLPGGFFYGSGGDLAPAAARYRGY